MSLSKALTCLTLFLCSGVNNLNYQRTAQLSHYQENSDRKITELAANQHSGIAESFIFVARDAETYSQLRRLIANIPAVPEDSFATQAYVGVFLGQRRTGGYDIGLSINPHGVLVLNEKKPPTGAMLKMVLSAPFKLFAVSVRQNDRLAFSLDETWKSRLLSYRLSKVETKQKTNLSGGVELLRSGSHLTCFFHFEQPNSQHSIVDISSTEAEADGGFTLLRVPAINGASLRASGKLEDQELTLQTVDGSLLLWFTRQP